MTAKGTGAGEVPVSIDLERRTAWFIKLRWLAAAGVICAIEIARRVAFVKLQIGWLYAVVAGLIVYNAALYVVARRLRARPVDRDWAGANPFARLLVPRTFLGLGDESRVARAALFAFVQVTIDDLFLALLLHFSGGVESPFSVFFVFHVVMASILLSRRATYLQTTVGYLFFAAVVFGECFGLIDHHSLNWVWPPNAYRTPSVIASSLLVLGATLYLASYLCSTIAVNLRERLRSNVRLAQEIAADKRELEIAYQKLRESEHTKSQYMRKVAHELRGPLGTIETALKVVLQGMVAELPGPSRDLVDRAQRRAGELVAVTQDLLVLSRAREAGLSGAYRPVALEGLVAEVLADLGQSAERKGVMLSAETASSGAVLGDPVAVRQLVANLVENGIRYTPPGRSVTVRLHLQEERVVLEVEDTGIGIAAEDLPRVFDEFYRGTNARNYVVEGTGLGLAIVKAIVERHGGTVTVQSQLGRGTRFTVSLPAHH